MKDKHFLFSLSLAIAVAAIMLLSIFVDSSVFDGIAQSITIPFLLFTVVSCVFSIAEEIINICNTKSAIEKEKYDSWDYYKKSLETQLGWVSRYDNPQNKDQIETNELIDQKEQQLEEAKRTIEKCSLDFVVYTEIKYGFQNNKLLKIIYTISLSILILSMMISPVLSQYFSFIPTTTLTLLSLFFAILEILLKDVVANKWFNFLYNKHFKLAQEIARNQK